MVLRLSVLSGTTWVSRYQKKHSPTHTIVVISHPLPACSHLLWSTASYLFNLHAWQSFSTISLQVFFGPPLGLAHLSTNSRFALTPISTCVHPVPVTWFMQPLQTNVFITLYMLPVTPFTFPMYPLLTTRIITNWIITNASTRHHKAFLHPSTLPYVVPTNHNLGFIHICSHASILHISLPLTKPFN